MTRFCKSVSLLVNIIGSSSSIFFLFFVFWGGGGQRVWMD